MVHSKGLTKAKEKLHSADQGLCYFPSHPSKLFIICECEKKIFADGRKDANILKSREQDQCETTKND